MLTKPQAFYDNIHKQALGYQNPFYLRKAQRIRPTLYDGIVIFDKHVAMPVIDDEETLILLSEDFGKHFTLQQEMDDEQAFWFRISNPTSKPSDASPVKIEAPKELPKVSLVNESLKKLKFHLARFDNVVNIRTTPNARKEDLLLTVMNSMSLLGEYVNVDGKTKESCNLEAELLKSQNAFNNLLKRYSQLEKHCISLEASIQLNQEIFQKDESCNNQNALEIPEFFEKNDLKAQLQDKDSTICKLKDMIKSMREKSKEQNVEYDYGEIETKNMELENRKEIVDIAAQIPSANTNVQCMFKLNLEPLAPRLLQNRDVHIKYLKYAQEQGDILRGIVKQAKAKQPLDKELDFACKHAQQIHELLVYVRDTCPNAINLSAKKGLKCSTSKYGSKPTGNKRNDRISQTTSRNMKNKVESQPRKVNKKNRVVESICDVDVKHSPLNANSKPICANCNKYMFDGVHDKCLLDFVENVNSC
ncbi:hypothetical protein Tco_0906636 [Tanacetum coccineum]|uniref:Uncharacterized protein n=1 Tax=Tanacetum coccineum TaxID=301880 RepID=A0ABQ5CH14_9ASTR